MSWIFLSFRSIVMFFTLEAPRWALFGEAVVIANEELKKDFRYFIKQKGGMLAKGRLLGIQFETLFEDNLYMEISKHAIRLAEKLRSAFLEKGYPMLVENRTIRFSP